MSSKLSVLFYIILCLEIGIVLTVFPWIPQGFFHLSDWGNNYFLVLAARKTGYYGLQSFIASGWIRGAVSGIGLLNLSMAIWELAHFRQTVRALDAGLSAPVKLSGSTAPQSVAANARETYQTDPLSDYRRQDH